MDLGLPTHGVRWMVVDRLALHLCATERFFETRSGRHIEVGTPLYLRGVTDTELTVAVSAGLPDQTFRIARNLASHAACPAETVASTELETAEHHVSGFHVPPATPIIRRDPDAIATCDEGDQWALEVGPGRWVLLPRPIPTDESVAELPGPRSRDHIRATIRTRSDEFHRCYQWRLASNPNLQGRVMFRFVIDQDGSVVRVSSTEPSGALDLLLEVCMARLLQSLRFQPNGDGGITVVNFPFMFLHAPSAAGAPSAVAAP